MLNIVDLFIDYFRARMKLYIAIFGMAAMYFGGGANLDLSSIKASLQKYNINIDNFQQYLDPQNLKKVLNPEEIKKFFDSFESGQKKH